MEVSRLLSEFERICSEKQYKCTTLGCVGINKKFPLLVIDIHPKATQKTLVIFGGIHGNEISGTLAIQKRSSEVWKTLGAVKTEFEKFGTLMGKAQKNIKTGLQNERHL